MKSRRLEQACVSRSSHTSVNSEALIRFSLSVVVKERCSPQSFMFQAISFSILLEIWVIVGTAVRILSLASFQHQEVKLCKSLLLFMLIVRLIIRWCVWCFWLAGDGVVWGRWKAAVALRLFKEAETPHMACLAVAVELAAITPPEASPQQHNLFIYMPSHPHTHTQPLHCTQASTLPSLYLHKYWEYE